MKPNTEKQVQIPLRLLNDVHSIFEALEPLLNDKIHPDDVKYIKSVKNEIEGKFKRIEAHELFSKYKTAEKGSEVREYFRIRYLDEAGIHKSFRSKEETTNL